VGKRRKQEREEDQRPSSPLLAGALIVTAVIVLGAEPFEAHGQNSPKVIVAGSLAIAIYAAACQFWVVRGIHRAPGPVNWPVLGAMVASLLVVTILMVLQEEVTWLNYGLPVLIAGGVGGLAGNFLATRRTLAVPPELHPR
jgi:hypothetical protein